MNQITYYQQKKITILGTQEQPLFLATDICEMLGLQKNAVWALRSHPDNEKLMCPVITSGQARNMWFVNEPGLYRLIFQSRRPEAEAFKAWVFNEVLPSIRKTGYFRALPPDMPLDLLQLPTGRRDHVFIWLDIMKEMECSKSRVVTSSEIAARHKGERGFSDRTIYNKFYRWVKSGQDWKVLDRYASLYKYIAQT